MCLQEEGHGENTSCKYVYTSPRINRGILAQGVIIDGDPEWLSKVFNMVAANLGYKGTCMPVKCILYGEIPWSLESLYNSFSGVV